MLAKQQCLEGVGSDFSGVVAMPAVEGLSGGDSMFLRFWASLLTFFKSYSFWQLFYFENKPLRLTQAVSQTSGRQRLNCVSERASLGLCPPPSPVQQIWETFHICLYQHGTPPPLEATVPDIITCAPAEGLRKCTAQSYCTPCMFFFIF
jgi:hypothetical protein